MRRARMNTARDCHSDFFGVASSLRGSRFDTVEVRSSSLLVPTISFQRFGAVGPSFQSRFYCTVPSAWLKIASSINS